MECLSETFTFTDRTEDQKTWRKKKMASVQQHAVSWRIETERKDEAILPKTLATKPRGKCEAKAVRNHGVAYRLGPISCCSRWP